MLKSHCLRNQSLNSLPKITRKRLNLRWEDRAEKKAGQMVMIFAKILGERENAETQYPMALAFGPLEREEVGAGATPVACNVHGHMESRPDRSGGRRTCCDSQEALFSI